jgi:hypothetical protein
MERSLNHVLAALKILVLNFGLVAISPENFFQQILFQGEPNGP